MCSRLCERGDFTCTGSSGSEVVTIVSGSSRVCSGSCSSGSSCTRAVFFTGLGLAAAASPSTSSGGFATGIRLMRGFASRLPFGLPRPLGSGVVSAASAFVSICSVGAGFFSGSSGFVGNYSAFFAASSEFSDMLFTNNQKLAGTIWARAAARCSRDGPSAESQPLSA